MAGLVGLRRARGRLGIAAAVVTSLGALGLALPGSAAGRPLTTGFADSLFSDPSSEVRDYWFDRAVEAGAGIVRLSVGWPLVAPYGPPANPTNPADPAYEFEPIDAAVRDAAARGLEVMFTVSGAPGWAEGPNRPTSNAPRGPWKPDPARYAAFASAVASRYSGSFRPGPASPPLPPVRYYQAWNEPNLQTYLAPVWERGRAASPAHYRRMLNAFYDAVKAVRADNRVVTAGTAPYGTRRGGNLMRPLRFWRALLCLRTKRSGKLRPRKCPEPARFDIAAHHPITGAPRSRADHRDDATIPDLRRLRRVIRKAERSGRVRPRTKHPLWVTEIWWESDPPDPAGVRVRTQARWIAEALYLIWKQGVRTAIMLGVRDAATDPLTDEGALHSGVFYADATPKPSFSATRFPFVTERRGQRRLRAWGRSPRSGRLVIQRRGKGGWRSIGGLEVTAGEAFSTTVRAPGPGRLRAIVGGEQSLAWRQRR